MTRAALNRRVTPRDRERRDTRSMGPALAGLAFHVRRMWRTRRRHTHQRRQKDNGELGSSRLSSVARRRGSARQWRIRLAVAPDSLAAGRARLERTLDRGEEGIGDALIAGLIRMEAIETYQRRRVRSKCGVDVRKLDAFRCSDPAYLVIEGWNDLVT